MKNSLLKYMLILLAGFASIELLWADAYVEEISDTIIVSDTLYINTTDTIVLHDTCTIELPTSISPAAFNFWREFLLPLIVSILGAFGALYLVYVFLRPKYEICPIAAQSLNNRVWFLVRNSSCCAKLYSIKAELSYFHFNEEKQDVIYEIIDMDKDDNISILYPDSNKKAKKEDKYYLFHTRFAFYKNPDFDGVRLRVSATNTISNIFDATDRTFTYNDDIKWGEFIGGAFAAVEDTYDGEDLKNAKQLEKINDALSVLFRRYKDKEEFKAYHEQWENAVNMLNDLKTDEYSDPFYTLTIIKPTITETSRVVEVLSKIYNNSVVYSAIVCDKRDKYIHLIIRNIVQISQYMKESLTPKIQNNEKY